MANTWPAVLASSPVNRPIPAPSSMIDLPLKGGSKDRICTTVSILSNLNVTLAVQMFHVVHCLLDHQDKDPSRINSRRNEHVPQASLLGRA